MAKKDAGYDFLGLAKSVFSKHIGLDPLSIVDRSKGSNHHIFIFFCPSKNYVVKIPRDRERSKLLSEGWAYRRWSDKGVKIPEVYHAEKDYLILEFIEGIDVAEARLSKDLIHKIYIEVGKELKKMHSIHTQGYGSFRKPGIGKYDSWKDFLRDDFRMNIDSEKLGDIITPKDKHDIIDFFEDGLKTIYCHSPRLLHSDINDNNIILNNGKFSGLIDANDTISGDPMYDISVIHYNDKVRFKHLVEGYGDVDMKKVRFYTFYHLVWLLNFHHRKKMVKECRDDLKSIFAFIRRGFLEQPKISF